MINNPNTPTQRYPNPNFPPPQRPRNLWIWITGIVAIVLIIGIFAVLALSGAFATRPSTTSADSTATATSATPAPTATANPGGGSTGSTGGQTGGSTGGQTGGSTGGSAGGSSGGSTGGAVVSLARASAFVNTYYANINARYYQSAYNQWGSSYQNSTSYATFSQGFANTKGDYLQIGTATRLSDGSVKVPVTVTATVVSGASTTVNTYQGYYVVGLEGGQPRFLSANLQLTNSDKDSVKRAISLLEQYYADINMKDYKDAYSIWGSAYHQSTSYSQFTAGFANTKSDSISINSEGTMLLKDGSVQVPLTISAVNTSGTGTVTHTYHGYYIVAMENQVWHLVNANIQ